MFGIVSTDTYENSDFSVDTDNENYMFTNDRSVWKNGMNLGNVTESVSKEVNEGDTLKICLNLVESTITYTVNNGDPIPCFINIAKNDKIRYKLALSLGWHRASISLIEYECSYF